MVAWVQLLVWEQFRSWNFYCAAIHSWTSIKGFTLAINPIYTIQIHSNWCQNVKYSTLIQNAKLLEYKNMYSSYNVVIEAVISPPKLMYREKAGCKELFGILTSSVCLLCTKWMWWLHLARARWLWWCTTSISYSLSPQLNLNIFHMEASKRSWSWHIYFRQRSFVALFRDFFVSISLLYSFSLLLSLFCCFKLFLSLSPHTAAT